MPPQLHPQLLLRAHRRSTLQPPSTTESSPPRIQFPPGKTYLSADPPPPCSHNSSQPCNLIVFSRQAKSAGRQDVVAELQAKIASHDASAEQHLVSAAALEKHDAAKLVAEHKAAAAYHKDQAVHHRSAAAASALLGDTPGPHMFVSKHTRAAEHHDERAAFHEAAEHSAPDAAPELNTEFLLSLQLLCRYVSACDAPLLGRVMRSILRLRKLCSPIGLSQLYSICSDSPSFSDVAAQIAALPQPADIKINAISKELSSAARKRPNEAAVRHNAVPPIKIVTFCTGSRAVARRRFSHPGQPEQTRISRV
jgi:hypothetical protein